MCCENCKNLAKGWDDSNKKWSEAMDRQNKMWFKVCIFGGPFMWTMGILIGYTMVK